MTFALITVWGILLVDLYGSYLLKLKCHISMGFHMNKYTIGNVGKNIIVYYILCFRAIL